MIVHFASFAHHPDQALTFVVDLVLADHAHPLIAAALGVSRGTVVSTASRALAALARKAGEQA